MRFSNQKIGDFFLYLLQYLIIPLSLLNYFIKKLYSIGYMSEVDKVLIIQRLTENIPYTLLNILNTSAVFLFNLLIGVLIYSIIYNIREKGIFETILGGFVLSSLVNYAELLILGKLGIYHPLPLYFTSILIILITVKYTILKRFVYILKPRKKEIESYFAFLSCFILGATPILVLQLAFPITLWLDVPPNNIAPAQRVISFNRYDPLHSYPSAKYSLYQSVPFNAMLFSFITSLSGGKVIDSISPLDFFVFALTIMSIGLMYSRVWDRNYSWWPCFFFLLTYPYLRIIDLRGSSFTFIFIPLSIYYLTKAIEGEKGMFFL
ncbi:MAG: hypothetical protein ABH851_05075, partial [Methanobacteriota archaeon]